jgi:hypothetical protein
VGVIAVLAVILEFIIFHLCENGLIEWLVGYGGAKEDEIDIAIDSSE